MPLNLGLFEIFLWLDPDFALLSGRSQKQCWVLSGKLICPLMEYIHFSTWLRWCLLGFSTAKLLFFSFVINKYLWGDVLWDYVNILFLIKPPIYSCFHDGFKGSLFHSVGCKTVITITIYSHMHIFLNWPGGASPSWLLCPFDTSSPCSYFLTAVWCSWLSSFCTFPCPGI